MKINPCDQNAYFLTLREVYGEEIVRNEEFLNTAVQREFEQLRHSINARQNPKSKLSKPKADSFLFIPLQKCSFKCRHCWVFGSPESDCVLSYENLLRIKQNIGDEPQMTVSGGEFFLHPSFREILSAFPVRCINSNGFWGCPDSRRLSYLQDIKTAVDKTPQIDRKALTMILSYDDFHKENFQGVAEKALSDIISDAYEILPELNFRVSQLAGDSGASYISPLLECLTASGFAIYAEDKYSLNGNIRTISFKYQKKDLLEKTLFADIFPITRIGRAVFQESDSSPDKWWDNMPLSRRQFTIGPDGGVGLNEILYSPPVPYCTGNLIETPWDQIAESILRDPIAAALKVSGLSFIWEYLDAHSSDLGSLLKKNTQSMQQFMYLLLLEPERRLHINRFLTERLYEGEVWS